MTLESLSGDVAAEGMPVWRVSADEGLERFRGNAGYAAAPGSYATWDVSAETPSAGTSSAGTPSAETSSAGTSSAETPSAETPSAETPSAAVRGRLVLPSVQELPGFPVAEAHVGNVLAGVQELPVFGHASQGQGSGGGAGAGYSEDGAQDHEVLDE